MEKKYELTDKTITHYSDVFLDKTVLHQIKALKDFGDVKAGDIGGWVESEKNLSQEQDCWIYGAAKVIGNAKVIQNASVSDCAFVEGNAKITGGARVYNSAHIKGNVYMSDDAKVYGHAKVSGDVSICNNAEVFDHAKVSERANIDESSKVHGGARVHGNAHLYMQTNVDANAEIYGNSNLADSIVTGNAKVYGNASLGACIVAGRSVVNGNAIIDGDVTIAKDDDFITFDCYWERSTGHITWTRQDDKYIDSLGVKLSTSDFIEYWKREGHECEGKRIVEYVESVKAHHEDK